jgi:hypothetical protein
MIDEHAPHRFGGDGEKLCAVTPVGLSLIDQAKIGLVHETRRLKRVVGSFAAQIALGLAAQFFVDKGDEAIKGGRIASTPGLKERSHGM